MDTWSGLELVRYGISLLLGYFIGSLPTAYLLVKWKTDLDIRKAGSGNIGTMNAFDVTGSAGLSFFVLLFDLLKGVLAVVMVLSVFSNEFGMMVASGLGAVIGHNYSLWMRFKGGRGLATAAGVTLSLGWIGVLVWGVLWTILYLILKNIHAANIVASVFSALIVFLAPDHIIRALLPPYSDDHGFRYFMVLVCLLILVRHLEFVNATWKSLIKS